ncbi:hypothetical protein BDW75DRAFT_242390 [Aspergillus navahoensis]
MDAGAGVLPAQTGPVPTMSMTTHPGFHLAAAFDHAVGLAQHPATAVSPVLSAPLNLPQVHGSIPATIPQMYIQALPTPPGLSAAQAHRPQNVTTTDVPGYDSLPVHRQHYRPASVPLPLSMSIPILYSNHSQPPTPFAQHSIPMALGTAAPRPYQDPHNHQQWDMFSYACPQLHRPVHIHPALPMDISVPLEGRFVSWTARRKGDGRMNVSLDDALDDFVAGVDAEMKDGWALMPSDPSLGCHWPEKDVEDSDVGKEMIVEWSKMQ